MVDPLEHVLAPAIVEKAMSIFERFKDFDLVELVQARKAATEHVFGLIASGNTDEHKLLVSALAHLKSCETRKGAAKG